MYRRDQIVYAAALQAASWALQSVTEEAIAPELAALLHAVFWTEQLRWRAAALLTNVAPSTANGRVPVLSTTAGAAPPRVPVNV